MASHSSLPRTGSSQVLNIWKDEKSRTNLGNPLLCLTTCIGKRLFLRFKQFFLYFGLCLLPLGPFTKHYLEELGSIFSTPPMKYLYKLIRFPWAFSSLRSQPHFVWQMLQSLQHYYGFLQGSPQDVHIFLVLGNLPYQFWASTSALACW